MLDFLSAFGGTHLWICLQTNSNLCVWLSCMKSLCTKHRMSKKQIQELDLTFKNIIVFWSVLFSLGKVPLRRQEANGTVPLSCHKWRPTPWRWVPWCRPPRPRWIRRRWWFRCWRIWRTGSRGRVRPWEKSRREGVLERCGWRSDNLGELSDWLVEVWIIFFLRLFSPQWHASSWFYLYLFLFVIVWSCVCVCILSTT